MAATSVKKVENKTARRGFLKWAKSRKGQQTLIILAFTIIPLVLLAAFTYVPFAEMVKFSFYKMKYSTPVDKRVFVGWKNYIEVFRNKDIFASLWLSLYYMVGSVVQLALALFLATILIQKIWNAFFYIIKNKVKYKIHGHTPISLEEYMRLKEENK